MCKIVDGIVLTLLGACALSDWRRREIPLLLLLITSVIVVVLSIFCKTERVGSILGGALIGVVFFCISKCTKEAVGYGDSWLILLLGINLGVRKLLQVLFAASLAAGIYSLLCLWKHHWKRSATIPFVPFLTAAYMGVVFL